MRKNTADHDLALQKLSELLKHPDDLNIKIDFLRKKLMQEKSTIETQLKTDIQSQFDDIKTTFHLLDQNKIKLEKVKSHLDSVHNLCLENQTKIPGYTVIKELSRVHSNMVATHRYVTRFQIFQNQMDTIERLLLQAKTNKENINLLAIHYELYHAENFRDITVHQAKSCSQDVVITLNRIFRRVDNISEAFAQLLWELTSNLFQLIEHDKLHYLLHAVKVIELEELADKRALQAEEAKTFHLKLGKVDGSKWKLAEGSSRKTKNFKSLFLTSLKQVIDHRISTLLKEADHMELILDQLELIPKELKLLHDKVAPTFPTEYHIMDFFVGEYHSRVQFQFNKLLSDIKELGGSEILRAMRFVQDYHSELSRNLGVTEDSLEPPLLGGNHSKLVEAYLSIVTTKLSEWTSNIIKLDSITFLTRDKEPATDSEGRYYLSADITAFQSYDQQINLASESNSARVLVEVVKCCAKVAQVYQQRFNDLMMDELQRYLNDSISTAQGFVEYVIALMNNQLKSVDLTEPLVTRISEMLHDVYKERGISYIHEISDGAFKLASQGHDVLLQVIFHDLKTPFNQLYTSLWYEEDLMLCVVATLEDYCEGFHTQMHPYLFKNLIEKLLDRIVLENLKAFFNNKLHLKLPACQTKMEMETEAIIQFFTHYLDSSQVTATMDPLIRLQALATASSRMIFFEFNPLFKQYPDLPINLIENIVLKRQDIDRNERREIMQMVKNQDFNEFNESDPTIFSKLTDQYSLEQRLFYSVGF